MRCVDEGRSAHDDWLRKKPSEGYVGIPISAGKHTIKEEVTVSQKTGTLGIIH
jgi:hypothetical protein